AHVGPPLRAEPVLKEEETCPSRLPDPGSVSGHLQRPPNRIATKTIRLPAIRAVACLPSAWMRTCHPNDIVQQLARHNPNFFDRGGGFRLRCVARAAEGLSLQSCFVCIQYSVFSVQTM